jgi:predicted Zn-dependent protease with MMP-like domain
VTLQEPTDDLAEVLEALDEALDRDAIDEARTLLEKARALGGDDAVDVLYAEASIAWEEHGDEAAELILKRIEAQDPDHADTLYALARIAEEREDDDTMIAYHLRVLALDARADRRARIGTPEELDYIEAVARDVLEALPSPFAERLENVPVVLEPRPSRDVVSEGFDPRALGLFEGPTEGDTVTPAVARIVLFTSNLLVDFLEEADLSEQIAITLLHEIGHFFNLDEDDMERLGLD